MKIKYDKEVDAAYIQLSSKKPDGAVEMAEGVMLHTTRNNEIAGIEILDASRKFPVPSDLKGKGVYPIEPEVAVPIVLRRLRETKKLTQSDIAKVLGISYQAYQRLERPGKSNPTLKTLERLAKVFDKDLRLEFA